MRSLSGLYAITDPKLLPGDRLYGGVEAALRGGASVVQYRDKSANEQTLVDTAQSLTQLCEGYGAALIVNDSVEVCLASGAHGVHLGKTDGKIERARHQLGPDKILGVTCHSDLQYAQQCQQAGANYCAFGRMFASQTKPDAPPCSPETLETALGQLETVVAIGGISRDNAAQLVSLGVPMIAVIHALFSAEDIQSTALYFTQLFSRKNS